MSKNPVGISRLFMFLSMFLTLLGLSEQPKVEDYVDENGIRTTVEYIINDEGKKVKVRASVTFDIHSLTENAHRSRRRSSVPCKSH